MVHLGVALIKLKVYHALKAYFPDFKKEFKIKYMELYMQNSHEIDYQILGNDMQMVEVELDPQETVIAEAGAMNYMDSDIQFEAKIGDGSIMNSGFLNKIFKAGSRLISGESLFITQIKVRVKKRWLLQLLIQEKLFL